MDTSSTQTAEPPDVERVERHLAQLQRGLDQLEYDAWPTVLHALVGSLAAEVDSATWERALTSSVQFARDHA